jgi:hypothetical protein
MIFKAKSVDGSIRANYRREVEDYLREIEGEDIIINIEVFSKRKRSEYQNRYYWVVIREIRKAFRNLGYDWNDERTHTYFKHLYLSDIISDPITREETQLIRSTSSLSVKEFKEYLDSVIQFGVENLDMSIPSVENYFK